MDYPVDPETGLIRGATFGGAMAPRQSGQQAAGGQSLLGLLYERLTSLPTVLAGATTPGLVTAGNIDLVAQPRVRNPDGTISTVRSMSFQDKPGGPEILIPTVAHNGRGILSDKEAIEQYHKSGKHLGIFKDADAATAFARRLHEDYAAGKYDPKK